MRRPRARGCWNESGQLAVLSVLIIVTLVFGIIVTVIYNQSSVRFGVMNRQREKSDAIVQQGLAYALHALSDAADTWAQALQAQFPADFDPNHVDSNNVRGLKYFDTGMNNYFFTVSCSTGGALSPYQVGVLVTAYVRDPAGNMLPIRALSAAASQKTLSATMTSNRSASAALELLDPFAAPSSTFAVHWGPIVVHDTANAWMVNGTINAARYPRKFSGSGIGDGGGGGPGRSETANGTNTDNQEYWAYASLGYPPDIDMQKYQTLADATPMPNAPVCAGGPCLRSTTCTVLNCAHFVVGTDTAVFDGNNPGYPFNQPGAVIYVDGNVRLRKVAMDLVVNPGVYISTGALVATGNIIVGSVTVNAGQTLNLRLPPTFAVEYPYYTSDNAGHPRTAPPCWGQTGATCDSTVAKTNNDFSNANVTQTLPTNGNVHFRGFLCAQGNLVSATVGGSPNIFVIDGAVRANNLVPETAGGTPHLTILYDDVVNRSIFVNHLELQADSQRPVSVR